MLDAIRDTGDRSDETTDPLKRSAEEFKAGFVPTGAGDGTGAAELKRDAVREDVGWDRLSSHDDEHGPGSDEPAGAGE